MNLGETIYKYRTSKKLSQGDLAEMLDVSRQSISKWENNSATPDLDKIVKLSEIFGVTIDDLVKGEYTPASPTNTNVKVENTTSQHLAGRKIAGIILFCMAFLVILFLGINGAFGGGLILSTPFVVTAIICFAVKKYTGLWCAWAIYFIIDIYLRFATGLNRSVIFNIYYYSVQNVTMAISLIISWGLNLGFLFLVIITVLCYKNKPLDINVKNKILFGTGVLIFVFVKVFERVFFNTKFVQDLYFKRNVFPHILSTTLDWVQIVIGLVLIVNLVRYFTNKNKK